MEDKKYSRRRRDNDRRYRKDEDSLSTAKNIRKRFGRKQRENISDSEKENLRKRHYSKKKQLEYAKANAPKDGLYRLNKYIANAGECSRHVPAARQISE